MSISRMSPSGARQPICSRAMRRGGLRRISQRSRSTDAEVHPHEAARRNEKTSALSEDSPQRKAPARRAAGAKVSHIREVMEHLALLFRPNARRGVNPRGGTKRPTKAFASGQDLHPQPLPSPEGSGARALAVVASCRGRSNRKSQPSQLVNLTSTATHLGGCYELR